MMVYKKERGHLDLKQRKVTLHYLSLAIPAFFNTEQLCTTDSFPVVQFHLFSSYDLH